MANQVPNSAPQQEMGDHVHGYERFTGMMKWGAILCFILGIIILAFVL